MAPVSAVRLVVALALLTSGAPLVAQVKAGSAQPGKAQVDAAMFRMSVMLSAFGSKDVPAGIKDALAGCLYRNSFQKISETMDKAITGAPTKIDQKDPTQVLQVMSLVCGYKPASPSKPAPAPAPAKPGQKPGR
jgi:hypothetical protein